MHFLCVCHSFHLRGFQGAPIPCEFKPVARLLKLDGRQAHVLVIQLLASMEWPILHGISALPKIDRDAGEKALRIVVGRSERRRMERMSMRVRH